VCGRFSQAEATSRLATIFDVEPDADLPDGGYEPPGIAVEQEKLAQKVAGTVR
jgi:hypothetical protein